MRPSPCRAEAMDIVEGAVLDSDLTPLHPDEVRVGLAKSINTCVIQQLVLVIVSAEHASHTA
eukprot:152843-Pelagomonas_calceolata.AAC.1